MVRGGYIYIITNKTHSVLYTGVTSDLLIRVIEHKEKKHINSFTSKYNCNKLVYYEFLPSIEEAISREKQIKAGSRKKKISLIESLNKNWEDLFEEIQSW